MAWIERTDKRRERSKIWQDDVNAERFAIDAVMAALHYEGVIDSGVHDTSIDCTPIRVDNPQFDGWRITKAGWHYALGKDIANHGDQDGWIGFGGRQGQNWFKFRLARVGYLHWPTRTWDDIGGAPDYKRQNLSQQTNEIEFPTDGSMHPISSIANWIDVWKTPVGGSLSVSWVANGDRLKEEITINQAGREWIAINRPPTTPLTETYFGFVFQLDWSDIPKVYRDGVLQDLEGDFADDDQPIELKDALDRLLAFMPISDVRVPNDDLELEERQPLRKRFYKDTDGNYYLLLGVRADILNGMPAGDLIFDPTIDEQVGASGDDGYSYGASWNNTGTSKYAGQYASLIRSCFDRFSSVTIPDGVTIDVAYIQIEAKSYNSVTDFLTKIYAEDAANPSAPSSNADHAGRTRTTNGVDWDDTWTSSYVWKTSPSIVSVIQELEDSYDYSGGAAIQIFIDDDGSTNGDAMRSYCYDYDDNTHGTKLHIEYTAAAPEGQPTQIRTQGIPTGTGHRDRPGRWN